MTVVEGLDALEELIRWDQARPLEDLAYGIDLRGRERGEVRQRPLLDLPVLSKWVQISN